MATSKLNLGIALSRNFDKVTLEFLDEPVAYESEEELRAHIRKRFALLREEIDLEFTKIQRR